MLRPLCLGPVEPTTPRGANSMVIRVLAPLSSLPPSIFRVLALLPNQRTMESFAKINHHHHLLHLSPSNRSSFPNPISSIALKPPSKTKPILISSSSSPTPQYHLPKPSFETLKPFSSLLKTTCITIATASLFFSRFNKPSTAAPIAEPKVETVEEEEETEDEKNIKFIEEYLVSNPNDVEAIRTLMEVKIQDQKLVEAISLVDRLIKVEPLDTQWPLLKAHLHNYSGDVELAKVGFEELLSKDPLFVEAYHGLVMTISPSESGEMEALMKRIESAMEKCGKDKRKNDFRDFKLLIAQIRFIEGNYTEALKVYQELVREEPNDFRPYLYQGIIYTLLRKTDEAKILFDKYRRLVPKDHPYAQQFEDNVMATKAFTQILESGRSN